MVARPGSYQASNNSGELKPELHGRTDLKQFYGGLSYARNIEPVPQGGSRLSPRTRHLNRVRPALQDLVPTSTSSDLIGVGIVKTIWQLNFAAPVALAAIAVHEFTASSDTVAAILRFEYFDGVWKTLGAAFRGTLGPRTVTAAAPPRQPVTATAVRLQVFIVPAGTVNFAGTAFKAYAETAAIGTGRLLPFTFSLDQTYQVIATDFHFDIYRDGVFVGASRSPFTAAQLPMVWFQQRLDTMLLYHTDVQPARLLRDGSDSLWVLDNQPSSGVPQVDLGGTYVNQVVDVWTIYLRFPVAIEDVPHSAVEYGKNMSVAFTVNGETTPAIDSGPGMGGTPDAPDWAAFVTAARAAIEALPSIGAGTTVNVVDGTAAGFYQIIIEFTGPDNLGTANVMTAQILNSAEAAATTGHSQTGKPGGEPLFSAARGWPACAQFYQERLVTAGFKAKRGALLASVTGDYFNTNIELQAATGAILANLDTDGAERILSLARARHLVIFTTDGEYYISDRALSRTTPPTIVNSSRNGSAPGIPVVESEGSLIYVSRNNTLIYAATYNDISTSYESAPINLLASHIASNVTTMARQKAADATDADRLWLPRADGTMTLGTMLRGESVTAFTRWETAGAVRSAIVDGKNVGYLLVERQVGGNAELHFERLESGLIFDGAIEQTFEPPTAHVTGLAAHEGAEVWALADGYVEGPFTVAAGAIDLATASAHVVVGRWTAPVADTLPLPSEINDKVVLRRPKRVHTVKLDLVDTTSVAVGANGRPARNVALAHVADLVDTPLAPVNRTIPVTGLVGFSDDGIVRITQTKPGALAWRGITIEART